MLSREICFPCRSLDLLAENDAERTAAFRLIYKMLIIYEGSIYKKMVEESKKNKQKSVFAVIWSLVFRISCCFTG